MVDGGLSGNRKGRRFDGQTKTVTEADSVKLECRMGSARNFHQTTAKSEACHVECMARR